MRIWGAFAFTALLDGSGVLTRGNMLLFSEGVKENVRSHVKRDLLLPLM